MAFDDLWADRVGPLISTLPTFGSDGLQGNLTSSQGVKPTANLLNETDLPNIGGSAALTSIPQAAAAAGITGGGIPPAATTGSPSATTGASAANSWFVRGVIVILGFIFVAVGLSQFDRGQNVVRAAIKKI